MSCKLPSQFPVVEIVKNDLNATLIMEMENDNKVTMSSF
jgi:hypothetical protein